MDPEAPFPKLRLVDRESTEELERRYLKERQVAISEREQLLGEPLAPFKVGSVPYLNAVPLTRGIEDEIALVPPSQLAVQLRNGELDAALLSVTEVLFHDLYDILDGIAVASLGEVKSVFLAHQCPLEKVRTISADTASLTSVNLLKVLMAQRGQAIELVPLKSYAEARECEAVMLIGDQALDFIRSEPPHAIWDLGAAWFELTGLPFVYAVWALRRGVENDRLKARLREARDFGLDTLDHIIRSRTEYDLQFRQDYLGWHIHYHLGADEKRGLAKFVELLRKYGFGPVYDPKFVS